MIAIIVNLLDCTRIENPDFGGFKGTLKGIA
jgi:hypothetical protein